MAGPTSEPGTRVGLRSLLPYLRSHRAALAVVAVLSLLGAVGALGQPLLVRQVLDGIEASRPVGRDVASLVALLVAVAGLGGVRHYLLHRTAEGLVLTARRRLAAHLLRLPITEYDQRRTGDLLSRVGADTTLLRAVVTSGLFETVSSTVTAVGAAVAMVVVDPLLFAITVVGLGLGLTVGILFARRIRSLSEQAQARIGEMTSAVDRAISAARTIRASRAEERETTTVVHSAEQAYGAGLRIARWQALMGPLASTTVQGSFLVVLGVGGARVATGAISVGDLVAFVLFLFFLVMPLGQLLNAYTQLQAGLGALQRIEDVLRVPAEEDGPATTAPAGAPYGAHPDGASRVDVASSVDSAPRVDGAAARSADGRPPAVELDRVSFAYPGGGPVLSEVSFTVPFGTRTALVGPSGAGKSTVLALVERFYEVTAGSVRVAGVDVRRMPRQQLRARLGYVEQEAPVLAGTLRGNLLLTMPDADEARLLAVLAQVNLGELATRAEQGLDAEVGEGGVLLSGGERQRLAIARTLLARPPILLLDEPTSNLDARNEAALRSAIETVAADRTLLIVAHRLSTVADADQIVVLDRGRVVAVGRHAELVETSPLYRELAAHQLLVV
ncbi:MAG TPA: ABC transporter ATP-binding protein [Micromonosporaceae bacterium]|nr:ABC transporter ATP-binding protein [Micromonosporaceae bacterium]